MFYGRVLITEHKNLAPGYYLLKLLAPEVAVIAKPGQFVQLRVSVDESNDPLLARPISIFRINQIAGTISLIYKVVGRGTTILSKVNQGELINILGPIGNGFLIPDQINHAAFIAGGVGMPPLFCLAEYLRQVRRELKMTLFYGGRTQGDLLELGNWSEIGASIHTITEDGSNGQPGLVTELFLAKHLEENYDFLIACGPQPMLQAIQKIALTEDIRGQLSLEAHMACGVGACLGCTCKTVMGYRRVCADGPVFSIKEVVWS